MVETVNIGAAKTQFSRLLARVEAGDRGRVIIHDNFDDPLPDLEEYM